MPTKDVQESYRTLMQLQRWPCRAEAIAAVKDVPGLDTGKELLDPARYSNDIEKAWVGFAPVRTVFARLDQFAGIAGLSGLSTSFESPEIDYITIYRFYQVTTCGAPANGSRHSR